MKKECGTCKYWERDTYAYGGIFFGKCIVSKKVQSEYHVCDIPYINSD